MQRCFQAKIAFVLAFLMITLIVTSAGADKDIASYDIFLLNGYYDSSELENFNPLYEEDAYLINARSFSIDLEKKVIRVRIELMANLPLPATVLDIKSKKATISIDTSWHTIVVLQHLPNDQTRVRAYLLEGDVFRQILDETE